MPTPVDAHSKLHTAASYRQPLGVRCQACEHRALISLDMIGARSGSMRPLHSLPLNCSDYGGRDSELWLFVRRDEAEDWVNCANT